MADLQIPEIVAELLEPIPGESPSGEDVSGFGQDYDDVKAKVSGHEPDYAEAIKLATKILKTESKDLQIAANLSIAWYRTEKIAGLKNGVCLLNGLLERYSDQLFPATKKQIQALKKLNAKAVLDFFPNETISKENAQAIADLSQAFDGLEKHSAKLFPEKGPVYAQFREALEAHLKTAAQFGATSANGQAEPAARTADEANKPEESEKTAKAVEGEPAAQKDESPEVEAPKDGKVEDGEAGKTPGESEADIKISNEVAELLRPISEDAPAGEDASNSELMQSFVDAFQGAVSDHNRCIELGAEILEEKSKDLFVAVRLCAVWFQKSGLPGLSDGLTLLLELLRRFGGDIFPADKKKRSKAVPFLDVKRGKFIPRLSRTQVDKGNAQIVLEIKKTFDFLKKAYHELFDETNAELFDKRTMPSLKGFTRVIDELGEEAEEIVKKQNAAPKSLAPQPETTSAKSSSSNASSTSASAKGSAGAQSLAFGSANDSLLAIRKALMFMFEEVGEDEKRVRKAPEDPTWYGLSRQLKWSKLMGLPATNDKDVAIQVEGPNNVKAEWLHKRFDENDLDTVIADVEARFLDTDGFMYWFDAHRLCALALEKKGGKFINAASEIKFQLARLLDRIPDLTKLKFKGGKIAFADDDTLKWIDDEIKGLLGGGGDAPLLPPLMGEEYDEITEAYQKACAELPGKFDENLKKMQDAIAADQRKKGRFLRKARMADFCKDAKNYALAKAILRELEETIEKEHLAGWEATLCVSVWEAMYHVNLKIIQTEPGESEVAKINDEQKRLFEKISRHDVTRALVLAGMNQKDGE